MGKFKVTAGVMGSGKSSRAIVEIHKLRLNDLRVLVVKPKLDSRDLGIVSSRMINDKIKADVILDKDDHVLITEKYDYIVVDEAHMLSPHQITELYQLTASTPINVLLYCLRMSYKGIPFESASLALGYAEEIEFIRMVDKNDKELTHHIKLIDGMPAPIHTDDDLIEAGDFDGPVEYKTVTKQDFDFIYKYYNR